jgi:hypothetical protein
MAKSRHDSDPRDDGIFRAILAVLAVSVVAGALLSLTGELLFASRVLANAGLGMAVIAGAAYWAFRLLGRRAAERRGGADPDPDPGPDAPDS